MLNKYEPTLILFPKYNIPFIGLKIILRLLDISWIDGLELFLIDIVLDIVVIKNAPYASTTNGSSDIK